MSDAPSAKRERGYRDTAKRRDPQPERIDALFAPTSAQSAELDRMRARERASVFGLLVLGGLALYYGLMLPIVVHPIGLTMAGLILLGYAAYRHRRPPGLGPLIVHRSPTGEVTAGHRLRVTLLLRPWRPLSIDPFLIRLVARRGEGKHEEVAYETVHRIAEGQTLATGEAVGAETTISIPEDVPPTSASPRVRWRLEVVAGSRVLRSIVVRVGEPTRPHRKR